MMSGFRFGQRLKPEPLIETVRVTSSQQEQAEILEVRMVEDRLQERLRNAATAIFRQDEDVHQVREHRTIGHHSGERHLLPLPVHSKAE